MATTLSETINGLVYLIQLFYTSLINFERCVVLLEKVPQESSTENEEEDEMT
jgi:hypothetical protein